MTCNCCGHELAIVGKQEYPPKYNIPPRVLVECQNEGCVVYKRTSTTASHIQICEDARKEQSR